VQSTLLFVNYSLEHLIWILLGIASTVFWIWLGRKQSNEPSQQRIGLIQSLVPATLWIVLSLYMLFFETPVNWGLVLPFHVCYFINLLLPFMLWQRSFFLFEITYYMVMGGCAQALITPDLHHSFPHFINFRYFIVHMGLVQSILYAIFVYRFRPTWTSFGRAFLWTNIYFVFILGVNYLLGTNFMYLSKKPPNPTLLDLFGDWPWYIVGGEFLCLIMFTLVMLPFTGMSRLRRSEDTAAPN
jgi:hypothetical integral membrane protein (TIGR02206 family)